MPDATASAKAATGRHLPAHSHAGRRHAGRRRRRSPSAPATAAVPIRTPAAAPATHRGDAGSEGPSLHRRQDTGKRRPGRLDGRAHPKSPEEGEKVPAAAFTAAARLAGGPLGRRRGWESGKELGGG